jgi:hypothetical protein
MTPSQLFAAIKALFENQELRAILPALAGAFGSLANNPTAINALLQLAQLEAAIIAAQPNILQSELKLIADDLAAAAANVATSIAAKASAPPAAPAPAA